MWPQSVRETVKQLSGVQQVLDDTFVGRTEAIEILRLATVCQEHALIVGPPGTAKTQLITRFTQLVDATGFHYLLTRFTEPAELFGPLDLTDFQKGKYHVRTEGMLPEAQIVFLDEVFQGSSPILNTLLTILNERVFYNGSERQPVPLISLMGATNFLPDDPWLQAFADRFALRLEVDAVPDEQVGDLLLRGWELEAEVVETAKNISKHLPLHKPTKRLSIANLMDLNFRLTEVDLKSIRDDYSQVVQELRSQGVQLSDRRAVKGLKLIAGAAVLREARRAETKDFWPLKHIWTRPEESRAIGEVIQPRLNAAGSGPNEPMRPIVEIREQLEVLRHQPPSVRSEAAIVAHLGRLSKLRREIISDHPDEKDARQSVEALIDERLKGLEEPDV
jgi:MoxR-like ATPase